jgi:hypothetical protein
VVVKVELLVDVILFHHGVRLQKVIKQELISVRVA